ncbi:DUF4167 domain-containing protein [Gymnodinialimonas hymeniacidonis]|uniref:DUF4167 domain-containing protein n=1 Tax=Gymnodinialimonas hymeniacidonis TaxID=3126508 RepID=UPI0034C62AFC
MRSSKNRSRSKGNRNRSVGNIVNRVFDSSGPEGKVRGTPQQIIDKYNQLTRDAQLANDRVAAENFQQHAEHYLRMLAEAQREMDAKREAQQQQQQQNNQQGGGDGGGGGGKNNRRNRDRDRDQQGQPGAGDQPQPEVAAQQPAEQPAAAPEQGSFDAVIDNAAGGESGLVETPESAPKPKRQRRRRKPEGEGGDGGGDQPPQEAAE